MINQFGWEIFPLENENIREIVLPEKFVGDLRRLSRNKTELTGLMYGTQKDDLLFPLGYLVLGKGDETSCSFDPQYIKLNNEFVKRAGEQHPSLTTLLYHNHPRVPISRYSPEMTSSLQNDLENGIYDFLKDRGINPNIMEALAEESRNLSREDIDFARDHGHKLANILLSDTSRGGKGLEHVNAHKMGSGDLGFPNLFKLGYLENKDSSYRIWAQNICSSFKKIYGDLKNEKEYK